MSLFGALQSGVSGLSSQSSAMGAISDNITNVSTIGYKNTRVNFQTLVTKQTSTTLYSAGGVQSKPRQDTGVQGLLQASTSQTDISISGQGFFIVNEASVPTISNEFLFTRAGSFFSDDEGFLRNTSGFYLQAWPTDATGKVIPANKSLTIANQNIISSDFLTTVNLNRVGGTASSTTTIGIGANLPSNDTTGKTHRTDVQFFDSLGNANTMSFVYTRTFVENQWDLTVNPPTKTSALTIEDTAGRAFNSVGQLEFIARPGDGARVVIDGRTYEFDNNAAFTAGNVQVNVATNTTIAQDVASLIAAVRANDTDFDTINNRIVVNPGNSTGILFTEDGAGALTINPSALLTSSGAAATNQTTTFTVRKVNSDYSDYKQFRFTAVPADNSTMTVNGITYTFLAAEAADATGANTLISTAGANVANFLADFEAALERQDPQYADGSDAITAVRRRQANNSGAVDTLILPVLSSGSYNVVFGATMGAGLPTEPDGTATYTLGGTFAVKRDNAIVFNADGLPSAFRVSELEIIDFSNGAANMDDDPNNRPQITLDFGRVGEANGMTQFGAEFTPVFITQNGSRFGTFAGVSIAANGRVTALFDNGETRIVFQIPVATFTNVSALESRSGNIWNATEASGDPTLRVADNGPAGQVIQAALEQSTVDIGEEFTKMIVVQRAFSASAKIISTADEMLEELLRTKR
jgi:flagellar hook protein FlgE